jgi:hypothetical protein
MIGIGNVSPMLLVSEFEKKNSPERRGTEN